MESESDMTVRISVDPETKELVISDNGIGMTRDDVVQTWNDREIGNGRVFKELIW